MSRKIIDLTGQVFGRLTALKHVGSDVRKNKLWLCLCECGNEVTVPSMSLRSKNTISCGCYRKDITRLRSTTHGQTKDGKWSSEYHTWKDMIKRCTNPNATSYKNYGGRSIKICEKWLHSFENFLADMGNKPSPIHSIERDDVNGDYTPKNCRWATPLEQAWNKRIPKVNKSGVMGVHWNSRDKRWISRITVNGEKIPLGSYKNIDDAAKARYQAEIKYWNKKPS